ISKSIGKFYKDEVICDLDDMKDYHIRLGKSWHCKVQDQVHVPMAEVKDEENILKAEVVDEHVERIQELKSYEQHEDDISSLVLETTKKVGNLKTCVGKVVDFIDDEVVKGFGSELSMNSKRTNDLKVLILIMD
ncbi:hypothetical protein Tco_0919500, partial [Tanacetum coccineum]